jgi:hypothetical protein
MTILSTGKAVEAVAPASRIRSPRIKLRMENLCRVWVAMEIRGDTQVNMKP